MSRRPIRVIQWGCGLMGQLVIRYLYEKGAELVGAIDRNAARVGQDAGLVSPLKTPLGVTIRHPDEADEVFRRAQAQVCIICTRSLMEETFAPMALAARHGVNAITTGEEAFYSWTTSPELTRKLHDLAVENRCTLTGSGYQDVFWGHLIAVLAGATHRIDQIDGLSQYNVDDYGSALAEAHGVNLEPEEFTRRIAGNNAPSYIWHSNEWLCARMGWTIRSTRQELLPTTHAEAVPSSCLGVTISAGHATGMRAIVTTETHEGPSIVAHCVGKVYAAADADVNEWSLIGEPTTTVTIRRPATPALTCATIVNRLPQLIAAEPGFLTTDKLSSPVYLTHPLHSAGWE